MTRIYNVIDSDGHVLEPPDLWEKNLPNGYRDVAPVLFIDEDGRQRIRFDNRTIGSPAGFGGAGAVEKRPGMKDDPYERYEDGRRGGFDPHARIEDLDLDGIDAAFVFPTLGLYVGTAEDTRLAGAVCRTYNEWVAAWCQPYPDRLFGVAMLPMQNVELAVAELKFARSELGLGAAFIRPNPYEGRTLSDPAYDPLWEAAQDLDVSIGLHEGLGGMPAAASDRVAGPAARHISCHPVEMMLAAVNLIWNGVCERYPALRFGFFESGGGWMPFLLDRMDRHFDQPHVYKQPVPLTMRPSEYFQRQCWIAFEPVETTLRFMVEPLGANKILWATDYPHKDGWFPGAPNMVEDLVPSGIPKRDVLGQGAMDFYGLSPQ
jgi:uncharacterized protein